MSYVVFGNGRFLGIGANSAATSADGSTGSWTTYTLTGSYARLFYGTANTFVAFQTASTNIATTTDNGSSWTQQAVAVPGGQFWGGGYGNGTYVILGAQTPFATSTDGLSWTARTAAIFSGLAFNFVAFGNGLFVTASTAAGASRNIAISLDGINWTNQTTTTAIGNMQFQAGTYANGMFVLLAGNGGIAAPW
jgi:hypothetical protein